MVDFFTEDQKEFQKQKGFQKKKKKPPLAEKGEKRKSVAGKMNPPHTHTARQLHDSLGQPNLHGWDGSIP